MGREKEVKNPEQVGTRVEADVFKDLTDIQRRDGYSSIHELVRKIINEYVSAHKDGNDTFKLDQWNDNSEFMAIPAIMSNDGKLKHYAKTESNLDELKRVKAKCDMLSNSINERLNQMSPEEEQRIHKLRVSRLIRENDIRLKDPSTLSWSENLRRNQLLARMKEVEENK